MLFYNTNVKILAAEILVMVPLVLQLLVQFPFTEPVLLLPGILHFGLEFFPNGDVEINYLY